MILFSAMKPGLFYIIGAALAVFITFFILHYGMHQIGGYDQSNLVGSSWRLAKVTKPALAGFLDSHCGGGGRILHFCR